MQSSNRAIYQMFPKMFMSRILALVAVAFLVFGPVAPAFADGPPEGPGGSGGSPPPAPGGSGGSPPPAPGGSGGSPPPAPG
ncbi:MAG: hypothetical protein HON31_05375, partial [Chloroflexi bacterium]|nr:hypothetical protein [Chloroflexota bacterium]